MQQRELKKLHVFVLNINTVNIWQDDKIKRIYIKAILEKAQINRCSRDHQIMRQYYELDGNNF